MASAQQPPRSPDIDILRRQSSRLRVDAARKELLRISGSRIQFRKAAEPVGRAHRGLGRGLSASDRNPDEGRDTRQHRRILASQDSTASKGRAYLHISAALGTGYPEAHLA